MTWRHRLVQKITGFLRRVRLPDTAEETLSAGSATGFTPTFSADRPIASASDDRLGRANFAGAVARALSGWQGDDSLVVGLFGEWGSGKSSIKNMVVEAIRARQAPSADVLEFNPWAFGGQGKLMAAFVREVALALGQGATPDADEMEAKWRLYEERFRFGETIARGTQQLITTVLAVLGASGLLVSLLSGIDARVFLGAASVALLVLAAVLAFGAQLARALGALSVARAIASKKSVADLKVELANVLKRRSHPLIVVVDDVDRLEDDDIRLLFQLLKANADLPKLVYFVLFPRAPIERALQRGKDGSGREFLEKIVQVSFDVPVVDQSRLEKVLFAGLDEVVELPGSGFDQRRWTNLYLGGLRPFFASLRDVQRYLSSFRFHAGLLRSEKVFEVNVLDLIGLEVLRLFEPDVYAGLPAMKSLLTGNAERERKEQAKTAVETVLAKASETRREPAKQLLTQLFPALEGILGNHFYGSSFQATWARERRACSSDHFDRYFQLGLGEAEISEAELHELMSVAGDRDAAATVMRSLAERGLLPRLVERLEAYKEEIPIDHVSAFATALMDVGDLLQNAPRRMFEVEPDMHANRLVYWATKRADKEQRRQVVREALTNTTGLYLPVRYLVLEEDSLKKDAENAALTAEDVAELKKATAARIAQAAEAGALSGSVFLDSLLYAWQQWDGADAPKAYVAELVRSRAGLLAFLRAFLRRSISQAVGEYATRTRWYIRPTEVEQFASLDALQAALTGLGDAQLADEDERAVGATREAIERRQKGLPDYDPMTSSMHED